MYILGRTEYDIHDENGLISSTLFQFVDDCSALILKVCKKTWKIMSEDEKNIFLDNVTPRSINVTSCFLNLR